MDRGIRESIETLFIQVMKGRFMYVGVPLKHSISVRNTGAGPLAHYPSVMSGRSAYSAFLPNVIRTSTTCDMSICWLRIRGSAK